jgi:hypothetical protein
MFTNTLKAALLALTVAMTGCATQGTQEDALKLYNAKRSDDNLKTVIEGRIVSVRIGARGDKSNIEFLGSHSGNAAIAGIAAVSNAANLVESARKVFWITYKANEDEAPKVFYSNMIPSRSDLYTEGTLFRYIKTKDGWEYVRHFESAAEFAKFNE